MSRYWPIFLPLMAIAAAAQADPSPAKRADVEARAQEMFVKADANHDGILTREEYHAALERIVKAKGGTPTPKGWAVVDAQFDAVDQAHTGRIPRAGFVAAALAHFDGADLDHDGVVTPKEARRAARLKRHALRVRQRAERAAAKATAMPQPTPQPAAPAQ